MSPLSDENVESELSYAYLHAVAAHSHVSCGSVTRHEDNAGVDASLTGWGPFENGGYREEVDIKVQLKATVVQPIEKDGSFSYFIKGTARYDVLRKTTLSTPRILVVLFLPREKEKWITHTDDALSLHKCAYWVSLAGAGPSTNGTGQTVYVPKSQRFDVGGLSALMSMISRNELPKYQGADQ
jgi:hypothetical protein